MAELVKYFSILNLLQALLTCVSIKSGKEKSATSVSQKFPLQRCAGRMLSTLLQLSNSNTLHFS